MGFKPGRSTFMSIPQRIVRNTDGSTKRIINGRDAMIEQGRRRNFTQGQGYSTTYRFIGPKEHGAGKEREMIDAGFDVSYTEDGPMAIVEATRATRDDGSNAEVPTSVWEVGANYIEKEIYSHPTMLAELSHDTITRLKEAVKNDQIFHPINDDPAVSLVWWDVIVAGTDKFPIEQTVIRHTQIVSGQYARTISTSTNNGKIFTPAQMISMEGCPPEVIPPAESDSPANEDPAVRSVWGFRKTKPTMSQQARGQWQIVNEYVSGVWLTKTYTLAS